MKVIQSVKLSLIYTIYRHVNTQFIRLIMPCHEYKQKVTQSMFEKATTQILAKNIN